MKDKRSCDNVTDPVPTTFEREPSTILTTHGLKVLKTCRSLVMWSEAPESTIQVPLFEVAINVWDEEPWWHITLTFALIESDFWLLHTLSKRCWSCIDFVLCWVIDFNISKSNDFVRAIGDKRSWLRSELGWSERLSGSHWFKKLIVMRLSFRGGVGWNIYWRTWTLAHVNSDKRLLQKKKVNSNAREQCARGLIRRWSGGRMTGFCWSEADKTPYVGRENRRHL